MSLNWRSSLLAIVLLPILGLWAVDVPAGGDSPSNPGLKPEVRSPLSPEQALKEFRIDPGLRIELVASEPQIESPVAMAFDEDGKLWVVEMRDYPNGPAPGKPPEGRIKVLEDRDGDGRYETSRVFADQLLFANGLMPWRGGVIVTAAPHILYLKDMNGDGKADYREVLYEGFATQNPQLRVSHPVLGIDNWVYVANGLRGGQIIRSGAKDAKDAQVAQPINLSGMDFRFDLIHDKGEAVSGMGQYGNTFDDWGNRFVCDNNHHLRHVVLENRYLKRNPHLAVPSVLEDTSVLEAGPLSSGGRIYPISKNWTTSSLHVGRFTAACGVFIYRGDLLPELYRGAAFTCDPTGNLIHQEILTPHGATFRSKPARDGVEFFATLDEWCRPVSLADGPDGALYFVDMYRAVIEHPEFMPTELKNRPDLLAGKDKGRIWRIVPEGYKRKPAKPNLSTATTPELVKVLEHPDAWWRTTAQRLLLERQDKEAIGPLVKLVESSDRPLARLHAARLADRMLEPFGLPWTVLLNLLEDKHPRIREQAIPFACSAYQTRIHGGTQILLSCLDTLANDPDPRVRFRVALSSCADLDGLAKIALKDVDDRWTRLGVASNLSERSGKLINTLLKPPHDLTSQLGPSRLALLRELAGIVGARRDVGEVAETLGALSLIGGKDAVRWQMTGLNGLADGMGRRGTQLGAFLRTVPVEHRAVVEQTDKLLVRAAEWAVDAKRDSTERLEATRLLAHASWTTAQPVLKRLLAEEPVQEVRLAAIRALAAHVRPEVPGLLLKDWSAYSPALRREIVEAILRQPDRIKLLLDEIEAGRVKPGDLDVPRTRQLLSHGDAAIRDRARKLLQDNLPADRKEVLEKYKAALTIKGDPHRGRGVFQKHCATCHRVAGIGVDVGADIADTRTKTAEALLGDILNPNQAIDGNYINYLVQTKNGIAVTGVIAAETAGSVTLRRAENQSDTILRQDIESIQSTGLSLMPEGLEKDIPVEAMADLIDFLKNWRYLDGSVPLGQAEKIKVEDKADHVLIETDCIEARINKKGYVSGIAQGSFLDKKTGARELGFGLHIMDFLLAPGWRDDGYTRDAKLHGNLPKHYVEGPQICTQAGRGGVTPPLQTEIIRGDGFVVVRLKFTFTKPGEGYKAGSKWVQTLVFQPGIRYCLCSEQITSVNDVDNLFYRIDMPGHLKHQKGDNFGKVYLSYHGEIPASVFAQDFGPDEKHLYQRKEGKVPERMIRAYQVKRDGKPGPWLAGMTLDPAAVSEAWCHQRGYICFIQELHHRKVKAGETFGAAYVVGWFDSIGDMEKTYDRYKGTKAIAIEEGKLRLQ